MKNAPDIPSTLKAWIDSRQARGVYRFTRQEAKADLRITDIALKRATERLAQKNRIARIHGDFYVIIPLEYSVTGILPPDWFIADLMKHLQLPYYVGLLSAAVIHGASHQQPQQFQVITTKPLREIRSKGLVIHFYYKGTVDRTPIQEIKTPTGFMSVSTPEGTALDLMRYARNAGGLDRVFTVLQELGEAMDDGRLADSARKEGTVAYAQRLGWLLEKAEFPQLTRGLAQWVAERKPLPAKLEPSLPIRAARRESRWNLLINTDVEGDL